MKKSSETAGRKKWGFTEGSATTTSTEDRSNSRSARKKNMAQNNPTLIQKLKELAAEAQDDEEIVYELIPQDDSDNSNESRYHIITNFTVITVLIPQTGYTNHTIVHYLANFTCEKDRYNLKQQGAIGKGLSENDVVWITLQARQFK